MHLLRCSKVVGADRGALPLFLSAEKSLSVELLPAGRNSISQVQSHVLS